MAESQPRRYLSVRPLSRRGLVASVLIAASVLLAIASAVANWNAYLAVVDYKRQDAEFEDALAARDLTIEYGMTYFFVSAAAAVAFLLWLYRARANADLLCDAPARHSRPWVGGSWFCPVVNLWFPYQVMSDVWKASRPDVPWRLESLRQVPGSALLRVWWVCWVGSFVAGRVSALVNDQLVSPTLEKYYPLAIAKSVSAVLMTVAGALIIVVIVRISRWQEQNQDLAVATA
ncbi:protein of unknown function [Actinokineospora alba]|uniref:DUF4328 domain-containing protein n=1 Tax=Actinokineospora alba TaxID=504798 RepID=A0A1H0VBZ8_9PSEU|nr:DUF4328 domain-containing protein [Actinokineospora alba]TDP65624.1 uncharacterized protein DUF4328 [Actinokineospora alba]SDH67007.1 protein of unknown function [Actinokineospora alba]SDP75987.1 protein of unknown function [Actinokineospora alba]